MKSIEEEIIEKDIERERDLSHLVFCFYMDSVNRADYNSRIRCFSDKTHLQIPYLISLKDVYLEKYASDEEKKAYSSRRTNVPNYIIFCEQLFSLKPDERINFIISSEINLSDLKNYLNSYKRCNGDSDIESLIREYEDYLNYNRTKNRAEKKLINYNEACAFYQNIIDLGFYSVKSYAEYCGDDKVIQNHKKYRKIIINIDENVYARYKDLLEINRKKTFFFIKDKVEKFNDDLKKCLSNGQKYDIIDYYLSVGVPLSNFIEICKDMISSCEMCNFKNFSSYYIELENSSIDEASLFNSINTVNGRKITDEEKSMVYSFLKENDIPIVYFNCALIKYANGELDKYIGCCLKKRNSNV